MLPDLVDFIIQGKVDGITACCNMLPMTLAAAVSHEIRMRRQSYEPGVSLLFVCCFGITAMAFYTGEIMMLIVDDTGVADPAPFLLVMEGFLFRNSRFSGFGLFGFPAAEKKEKQAENDQDFHSHNLDTVP